MVGKVYKGLFLLDTMNNKIILTIFMCVFLIGFIQAEVFGTPNVIASDCPEQVVCDVCEDCQTNLIAIGCYIIMGIVIGIISKKYGKNLFGKRKKKTILDLDNNQPTDRMFEEASKAIEGFPADNTPIKRNEDGTFRW